MSFETGFDRLLEAIQKGNTTLLERLLTTTQYTVNQRIPYRSEEGKRYNITPLYWAVKSRQKEVCRYLLRKGANPWDSMVYGYYPMHEACNQGDENIVEEFISAKCDLNKPNADLDTPLHIACMRGHIGCITKLLKAGANPSLRNSKGHTALESAQYNNQHDLFPLFKNFTEGEYRI